MGKWGKETNPDRDDGDAFGAVRYEASSLIERGELAPQDLVERVREQGQNAARAGEEDAQVGHRSKSPVPFAAV